MTSSLHYLYSMQGHIDDIILMDDGDHAIAIYKLVSSQGQSGAPLQIFSSEESTKQAQELETIGVHIGCIPSVGFNGGTLITVKLVHDFIIPTLNEYADQMQQFEQKADEDAIQELQLIFDEPKFQGFTDFANNPTEFAETIESLQANFTKFGVLDVAKLHRAGFLKAQRDEVGEIVRGAVDK